MKAKVFQQKSARPTLLRTGRFAQKLSDNYCRSMAVAVLAVTGAAEVLAEE